MEPVFEPAKKDKISTIIIRQIRNAILQGKYQPGESLPTESEFVSLFGVSKHTVREALRALEGMGFITIRRGAGGGPVVSKIDWDTARESFANFIHFQDISISHLSEIRMLLEPYLARRAAENFTAPRVQELVESHEECEELIRQNQNLVGAKAEVMFHVLLAKYSENPILWIVLDFVNNILVETKHDIKPGPDFSLNTLKAHRKILQSIINKDGEGAAKHMRDHICEVEHELMALQKNPDK